MPTYAYIPSISVYPWPTTVANELIEDYERLRSRSASDAALIERLADGLKAVLSGRPVRDADEMLAEAEGRKGLCQNGDGNPVLRAMLCAECIKHAQETGAFL